MENVETKEMLHLFLDSWKIVRILHDKLPIFALEEVDDNGDIIFYVYENENKQRTIMTITITKNSRVLLSIRPLSFTEQLTNEEMKPLLLETIYPEVKWYYHHRNLQNAYFDSTDQLNDFLIVLENHF